MYGSNRQALVFGLNVGTYSTSEVFVHVKAIDGNNDVTWDSDTPARGFQAYDTGSKEDREHAFNQYYYYRTTVDPTHVTVDEAEAERISKLLKGVRVKLDKMALEYGDPKSFGVYAQRVAKALGIKEIGFYPPNGAATWMSGQRLRFESPSDAARHIDSIIFDWRVQQGQFKAAAAAA